MYRGRLGIPVVVELSLLQLPRMQRRVSKWNLKQTHHSPYPECRGEPWRKLQRERQGLLNFLVCEGKYIPVVRVPTQNLSSWASYFPVSASLSLSVIVPTSMTVVDNKCDKICKELGTVPGLLITIQ